MAHSPAQPRHPIPSLSFRSSVTLSLPAATTPGRTGRATATHEGQHQLYKHVRDIEPTGEEGTASGITLYRIEGGKFVEMWNYHNVLEYALEHGMAGAPGGGS